MPRRLIWRCPVGLTLGSLALRLPHCIQLSLSVRTEVASTQTSALSLNLMLGQGWLRALFRKQIPTLLNMENKIDP